MCSQLIERGRIYAIHFCVAASSCHFNHSFKSLKLERLNLSILPTSPGQIFLCVDHYLSEILPQRIFFPLHLSHPLPLTCALKNKSLYWGSQALLPTTAPIPLPSCPIMSPCSGEKWDLPRSVVGRLEEEEEGSFEARWKYNVPAKIMWQSCWNKAAVFIREQIVCLGGSVCFLSNINCPCGDIFTL